MSAATTVEPTPVVMDKPELSHQESFSKEEETNAATPQAKGADLVNVDLSSYVPGGEAEKKLLRKVRFTFSVLFCTSEVISSHSGSLRLTIDSSLACGSCTS